MPIQEVPPLNASDERIPHEMDFSDILGPQNDSIASIVYITAIPDTITVGAGQVVAGKKPGCAVQYTLGLGVDGETYTIVIKILSVSGTSPARSMFVPVGNA